jgi:Uncharacterized protein related to glutamine synthetase
MVFNDATMRLRLPKETYKALKQCIATGTRLEFDVANVVANAMKEWAVEKGATHFTHWFQPMTGITAEKHDSFINPTKEGEVLMEFSGKALIQGEPDASSFPSGGLRATFEARGYTAWDPTSYAFIKDGILCIPTAFCSYSGEALDKKTPLLRSMQAIDKQAKRLLKFFDNYPVRVLTTVGPEQEYFLIDRDYFNKRMDLVNCGRTLFGARPPKGQELEDHYFGAIKPRISAFMKDLNEELWKLGVLAKTEHNEVAPAQHELAPIFSTTNIATDHNQITMELMKSVASRHNLACLLHEKPFAGINGSGKHNNWSLSTDSGQNLLEPGDTPFENLQFLLFLMAVIKAVDEYQDLLRASVTSAGNDHRLGANEAPPAIISIFLGEELTEILEAIDTGRAYKSKKKIPMELGVDVLPHFSKDTTDRNRTSPFAFTGNKFEFRMVGSAFSIADPNTALNTIVAEEISQFCDILEKSANFKDDAAKIIKDTIKAHKRIIFNGNNYSDEWVAMAESRGLLNKKSTPDALPALIDEKNVKINEKHGVYTKTELHSRYEILLENYCKTLHIEALTMIDMTKKEIIPSVLSYEKELSELALAKKSLGKAGGDVEEKILDKLSSLTALLYKDLEALETDLINVKDHTDSMDAAKFYRSHVFASMASLRGVADELETLVAKKYWAYPTYFDLLFSVK